MSKLLSAGFVIICPTGVLLGHTTGADHWDIPKGGIDGEETALEGATRELYEETGLRLAGLPSSATLTCKYTGAVYAVASFRDLGRHEYTKRKDLHLFELRMATNIDTDKLKCESMVDRGTYKFPELDRFVLSPTVGKHVTVPMYTWLKAHM